ncbi:TetR family transcriptional regulator C-terminal domain-containing protein [Herbiconiux sp. KACC 21604]|uniref:TetR family transcriptional regulator C-terminal domain-containing protein n=1 Tax=unclassified Herbiconiux TaxID=2618217 RepID=UPI001491B4E3|nr:TetR family transcriptional regulator C-terminal domain-containing protein [Herbiconiux sp. SALV-R1]QJU55445.1 TetR family transcriptional regulator C-terminal domain-containing protein [Herbiconiux sp. SALV-R1]WPO86627.1 TetR family transcriptional regulator C-terminal domain-containing protein [Herbiconiux sp. KACC 21604]
MSRPPRIRLSADERAAQLAATARELALEEGLSALTLRAVAARAAVAPALVAHYEPSMDALVARTYSAIVGAELDEVAALLAAVRVGAHADGEVAALAALIRTLLDPARDATTVVWVEAWGLGRRNEALAEAVREHMAAWHAVVTDLVEAGVASGCLATDDPPAVARQVIALIDGANAQAMVLRGGTGGQRLLIAQVMERMLGLAPGDLAPGDAP